MAGRTRAVTRAEQSRIEEKTVEGLSSLGGVSLSFLKSLGFLTASFPAVSTRCVIFDSDVGKLAPPRPVSISLAADRWITEAVKGVAEASLELWKKVCESIAKEGGGSADVMDGDIQVDTVRASMEWGRNFSTQFTIADRYLEQCLSLDELFDATGGEERRFYGLMDSVLKQKLGYPFDSIPEDFCQSHWEWMRSRSDQEQQEDNPFEHGFVGSTNSVQGEKWNALSLVVEEDAAPQNERSTVRNHSPRQFGMTELLQLCAICHGDPSDLKAVGTEEPFVSDLYAALDRYLTASRQPSQEDEEDLLTMSRDSYLSKTANTDPLPRTQSSPSIPVLSKPPDILRVSVALPQENAEAESNSAHQHSSEETQILSQIAPQVSAILHQLSGPSKVWNLNQFLETTFPHGWDLRAQQAATNKKMQECARQLMNLRLYSGAESLDSVLNRTADMIEQDPITFLVHGADRKITREERNKITEICAKLRSRAEEVLSKTSALRTELLSLLGTINSRSALDLALAPEVENATQNSSYSSSCTESSRPSSPLPQQDAYDLLKDPMYGSSTYVLHSALVKRINPLQQRSRTTTIDLTESTEDTASKKSSARPAGARDIRTYMGASTTRRTTRSQANRCSVDSQEDQYLAYVRTEWGWWLRFDGKDLSAISEKTASEHLLFRSAGLRPCCLTFVRVGSGLLEKDIEARNFIARAPLLTQKKRKRGEKTPDAPIEVGAVPDDPMDVTNENTQDHDVVGEDVENQNEPPKGKTGQPRRRGKRGKGVSAQKNGGSMSEVGLRGQMNGGAGAVGKGTTVRQGIAGAAARASKPNGNGSVSASEVPRSSSSSRNIGGLEVVPYDDDGVNYDEEVWQDENISGDGSYGKEAANKARTATPSVDRLVQNRTIVKTYGRKTRAKKFIPAEDPNDPIAVSRTDRSGIPIVRTSNPARTPAFSPTTKKPEPKSIELDIDPDSGDESVSKAFQAMRERVKNKRARTPARTPTPHTPQRSGSDPEMPNQVDADALENFMSDADPESRILIQQMLKEEGMYRVEHMDVDDERAAVLGN